MKAKIVRYVHQGLEDIFISWFDWPYLSVMFFQLKNNWWLLTAIGLVLLSQALTIFYWHEAKFFTAVNIIILAGVVVSYHRRKFNSMVKNEVRELLFSSAQRIPTPVTLESLAGLPTIVQKWLVRSNVIGKEKMNTVHLKQKGRMRTTPTAEWMDFKADQHVTTSVPGFIWKASIETGFLITITGRDRYVDGHGNMLIKAMNIIPIANGHGKEVDLGTMHRYLAEMSWFPTAALNDYIFWEPVGQLSARATMRDGNLTVSGIFSFNAEGDVTGFDARRYGEFKGKYSLETWSVRITGYKEFNGIRIPNKTEVTWKLSTGDFTWLEVEVTDIAYNIHNDASYATKHSKTGGL